MTHRDPPRLIDGDDALGELFSNCDDDRVELDLDAALARHRSLVASGVTSVAPSVGGPVGGVSGPSLVLKGGGLLTLVVGGVVLGLWLGSEPETVTRERVTHEQVAEQVHLVAADRRVDEDGGAEPPEPSRSHEVHEPIASSTPEAADEDRASARPITSSTPEGRFGKRTTRAPSKADLARELELIAKARKALASGDHQRALTSSQRSLDEFPQGTFTEEARALEILALVGLGRRDRAQALATRFRTLHPNSALDRRIEDALSTP